MITLASLASWAAVGCSVLTDDGGAGEEDAEAAELFVTYYNHGLQKRFTGELRVEEFEDPRDPTRQARGVIFEPTPVD